MNFGFFLREALSDVSGDKILSIYGDSAYPVKLDYELAALQALEQIDTFISPASLPSVLNWAAGNYILNLVVNQATNLEFTVELWRADLNGNDLQIVGTRPALQMVSGAAPTNPQTATFTIQDAGSSINQSDRLKLKLFAQNNDTVNQQEFEILCSVSGVGTPIAVPTQLTNQFNTYRRGRFLGYKPRPGEGFDYFNAQGQDLVPEPF